MLSVVAGSWRSCSDESWSKEFQGMTKNNLDIPSFSLLGGHTWSCSCCFKVHLLTSSHTTNPQSCSSGHPRSHFLSNNASFYLFDGRWGPKKKRNQGGEYGGSMDVRLNNSKLPYSTVRDWMEQNGCSPCHVVYICYANGTSSHPFMYSSISIPGWFINTRLSSNFVQVPVGYHKKDGTRWRDRKCFVYRGKMVAAG